MSLPDLIILDFDGVLADSEIVAARVEARMLTAIGYPIEPEEMAARFAGMTFTGILKLVETEAGIPVSAAMIEEADRKVDERLARELKPVEGAAQLLSALAGHFRICSNSSMKRLKIELEKTRLTPLANGLVHSAVDTPDVKPKPAPDIYLHAAHVHGADPKSVFVIEDSVSGVRGAVDAGMRVIGFTGASHSWPGHSDLLVEAGAETVINRLMDAPGVISALAEFGRLD